MAYFEGVGGSGGSIVVTCDSEFAGSTISCSDGTNTMTAVCPSVSPYEVEFMVSDSGTWEISATVSGTTYTTEVVVDLELEATLEYGFAWRRWVTYGGLDPSDYEDLTDVFSDEAAVRQLMLVHDSADYLISAVTDDVDTLDSFVANDTAMKWLGLCDYVCDGIVAVTGAEAKLLGSTYWERYLKDYVPVMTSDSAPYGSAFFHTGTAASGGNPYKAFDGDETTRPQLSSNVQTRGVGYKFTNPINVRKFYCYYMITGSYDIAIKLQYSDDGTNYTDAYSGTYEGNSRTYFDVDDCGYHIYWKVIITTETAASGCPYELQFYGRSLDVSVPVMTSNTAPYGEAFASSEFSSDRKAWNAFDNVNSTRWNSNYFTNSYVGYSHPSKFVLAKAVIGVPDLNDYTRIKNYHIEASNTGNSDDWTTLYTGTATSTGASHLEFVDISNTTEYKYYRLYVDDCYSTIQGINIACHALQFFGKDYSEKEFETGTTRKWLYDHGVELENIEINDNTTKEDDYISIKGTTTTYYGMIVPTNSIDLTDYSIERVKIGDVMSGNVQIQASSDKTSYNSGRFGYKAVDVGSSDLPNNLYYDVSAVNQNAYPNIVMAQVNSTIDISEWWLE